MIYGIIVSIIEGKQVASVSSFTFEDLNTFEIYNNNVFKPTAELMGINSSLMVCTSLENLIEFCQKVNIEFDPDKLIVFKP